jgi:hypothetical protein
MQQVHLRINDAATGQPTPVRLRITDANGTYYAPFGRLTEFATGVNQDVGGNVQIGAKKWCYIDGTCEILVPPGQLHIEITKGPEYKPIDEEITLLAGKMSLRFTIERWCDMRKEGWYSGDTRVHFMSPDAALLEGQAEDVAVVNLLVWDRLGWDRNILSFSGQSFSRQTPLCGVAVNTLNWHGHLGYLGLLHCHRIVFPLNVWHGVEGEELRGTWTLRDWCGQCHRKNGLVVCLSGPGGGPESLADLMLGEIDALEWSPPLESEEFPDMCTVSLERYERLCAAELLVPLVAASGKKSNQIALGVRRTYAHMGSNQSPTYSDWIEAVRAGRTFVSDGPVLCLTLNGEVPGRTLEVAPASSLKIRLEASCWDAFERVQLFWNGSPIAEAFPGSTRPCRAVVELNWPVRESGWLSARCIGQHHFAQISSIGIRRSDAPAWADPAAIQHWLEWLDRHRAYPYQRVQSIFQEARTVLADKLS